MAEGLAPGTAVLGADGAILATAGARPSPVAARVPDGGATAWSVLVGPREDESPYAAAPLDDVADVVGLVLRAVTEQGKAESARPERPA